MATPISALFRSGEETRICRLYSDGWDSNIAAWQEEVEESFAEICKHFGDDPESCKLVGEAKWVWMRFSPSMIAKISLEEFNGASQVTMMRVHRIRGKRAKADEPGSV